MIRFTPWKAMFCDRRLVLSDDRVRVGARSFFGKLVQESVCLEGKSEVGAWAFAFTGKMDSLRLGELCSLGACAFAFSRTRDISYTDIASIYRFHRKAFFAIPKDCLPRNGNARYFGSKGNSHVLVRADRGVTELTLADGVRFLFHGALRGCKRLRSIHLPDGLCEIGKGVFHPKLPYAEYEGALYFGNEQNPHLVLVRAKRRDITKCTVHKDTKYIAQDAFAGCRRLEKIVFDARGVRMSADALRDCKRIVSYEGPVEPLIQMKKDKLSTVVITEGEALEKRIFDGAPNLSHLSLPEGLRFIASGAVRDCPKLSEIIVPLSVEEIGRGGFCACPSLAVICEAREPGELWDKKFARGVRSVRWDGQGSISVGYYVERAKNIAIVNSYEPTEDEEDILIPAQRHGNLVHEIRNGAFTYNKNIKQVKILSPEVHIDFEAFAYAEALTEVHTEHLLGTVGMRAFANCESLQGLTAGEGIESIAPYAFDGCVRFCSLSTPKVGAVGAYAFRGCRSLPDAILVKGARKISKGAFSGCESIRSLTIPEGVEVIEAEAFRGCSSLSELKLPSTLKRIEGEAFCECTSLVEVKLPAKIEYIGAGAFMGCTSLIHIGGEGFVTQISPDTFRGCTALTGLGFFSKIEHICARAFMGCSSLTRLSLFGALRNMEDECFAGCTGLTHVDIPVNIKSFGKYIFRGCTSLVRFDMHKKHTRVPEGMFEDCGFQTLELPAHVQVIGRSAFGECHELTQLVIPETVRRIEPYAFQKCGNLKHLTVADSIETVSEYAFSMCGSLTSVRLGNGVSVIAPYAFAWCGKLSEIEFGASLKRVSEGAFAYCNALLYLDLPDGLSAVEQKAFFYSRNLKTVWIPASVTQMGTEVFLGCEKLTANCEVAEPPSTWHPSWISEKCDVKYGNAQSLAR